MKTALFFVTAFIGTIAAQADKTSTMPAEPAMPTTI
jgi:hypothetical protein